MVEKKTITVPDLAIHKVRKGRVPLTMVTAYDATSARLCQLAGVDLLLVGDSLGMVVQGHDTTLPVTVSQMLYHIACVKRGAPDALIVGDMNFGSYQASVATAVRNATRFMTAGASLVKLEGASDHVLECVRRCVESGIPVMGHVGLTPQFFHLFGGFKTQGRSAEAAEKIRQQAHALQAAGVCGIVVESVPTTLAEVMTRELNVPTIGIGAGVDTDGQVLVFHDVLGLDSRFKPKFVKRFAQLESTIIDALKSFSREVQNRQFPDKEHSFL